ncbi:EF-hand and coiled-coil domain-containing protein 1 isoform X2 [Hyperolius riggenbachi]|uniref:EF-hand and coiled-coil domain-containing protein 1 isoform X2 n=1 Tax=Hyperolius riggenbachi TaxID=752182 RepID=UPI0035A34C54
MSDTDGCCSVKVGLHRNMASQGSTGLSAPSNSHVLSQSFTVTTRCVQREVNLIRSSRDEQMEEVIKMNKDLEEELRKTQKVLVYLEEFNQRLLKEQAEMRRRAEDARRALQACYGKVKNLEEKSNRVSALQMRIDQMEAELQHYKAEETIIHLVAKEQKIFSMRSRYPIAKPEASSPTKDVETLQTVEEQLFRSVEGQAASDEEEERWMREPAAKVQEMLTRVSSCCASGCDERRIRKLLPDLRSDGTDHRNMLVLLVERVTKLTEELTLKEREVKDMEVLMEEMKEPFIEELDRKVEEIDLLRMDLQMLETERVRLSLIEEKLLDVLQLLQQLRDLEISGQDLGGMLLNTLEICREPRHGREHILEILDTLHQELSLCDLLRHQQEDKDSKAPSLANSLVISC